MYINMKYLAEKEITLEEVIILQLAKQQKFEDCTTALEEYERIAIGLEGRGYIKRIKGTSKDSELRKLRITKSGDALLSNIETPELLEEDLVIFEWLKSKYLAMEKQLGNQKKTKMLIAQFRVHSGIEKNKLSYLVSTFINDDNNMEFNQVLQYVFHKSANLYSTKFKLDESRLYNYYLQHKEHFDNKFETL